VQRIVYADNEANYCPTCQTEGRLLADRSLSRLLKEDWPRSLEELEERRAQRIAPTARADAASGPAEAARSAVVAPAARPPRARAGIAAPASSPSRLPPPTSAPTSPSIPGDAAAATPDTAARRKPGNKPRRA
jgi:hypothetical protein